MIILPNAHKWQQGHLRRGGPAQSYVRRRPTLPQPLGCSTIGAEGLDFRVRDGTGYFPFAMAAVTLEITSMGDQTWLQQLVVDARLDGLRLLFLLRVYER